MTCDLVDFVNRELALAAFASLLGHRRRRILLIHGPEGIGKSCLLRRLRQDCRDRGAPFALVDFRGDRGILGPRDVVLRLQEQIGGPFAAHLEQAELEIATAMAGQTVAGSVVRSLAGVSAGHRVAVGGEVQVTGDIFGGDKVVIRNSPITILPANGADLAQGVFDARRQRALREALALQTAHGPLIVFFDSYEEALPGVTAWLRQKLLRLIQEDGGDLSNLWLVIAGRQTPLLDEENPWRHVIDVQEIAPFTADVIRLFWVQKRRLDGEALPVIARSSAGLPALLSAMADNFGNTNGENNA